MADIIEFESRDALIRRRTEAFMPELAAAYARAGFPMFALERNLYRAVLSALLRMQHRFQLTELQAITRAWHVVNEMRDDVEPMRAPMHNAQVDRS